MTLVIRIADIMAKDPVTFAPDLEINRVVAQLLSRRISGAPVVDGQGTLVGILTVKDCFKAVLSASYYEAWGGLVSDYMSREVETVEPELDIVSAAERFLASPYRRFPVVDAERVVGVVSRFDVLRAFYTQR